MSKGPASAGLFLYKKEIPDQVGHDKENGHDMWRLCEVISF